MASGDIFECSFVAEVNGQPTVTVLHCEQSSSGDPTDAPADVRDAIVAEGILTEWADRTSNEVTLACLKIQKILPIREPAGLFFPGTVGTISDDAMSSGCSAMHFWQPTRGKPAIRAGTFGQGCLRVRSTGTALQTQHSCWKSASLRCSTIR